MGALFETLCKGPVVVIDDQIGNAGDLINNLVEEIKGAKLPVLCYKSLDEARDQLYSLSFSNFIILDWMFLSGNDPATGVLIGAEAEAINDEEVMKLIRDLQKSCLGPIFIVSALDKGGILAKLKDAGISTQEKSCVFVENKGVLCKTMGKLISTIEEWVATSPHVYLAKAWTNEWNTKNNSVFWDLYDLNPDWPTLFYLAFEKEGDPIIALRDTLFQLIFSEVDVSGIDSTLLKREPEKTYEAKENESLRNLYQRLVYLKKDIKKDIRPGDVFKKDGYYYLNIRPECDTTKRAGSNPEIYLLKGEVRTPQLVKETSYKPPFGIIDKETEITMQLLDGNSFVVFKKKNLLVEKYSKWKELKICRVSSPFITQIRHSYSSYVGRFGTPGYPEQILGSLFESVKDSTQSSDS